MRVLLRTERLDQHRELAAFLPAQLRKGAADTAATTADDVGAGLDDANRIAGLIVANADVGQEKLAEDLVMTGTSSLSTARWNAIAVRGTKLKIADE